jgi:hypothetical protein
MGRKFRGNTAGHYTDSRPYNIGLLHSANEWWPRVVFSCGHRRSPLDAGCRASVSATANESSCGLSAVWAVPLSTMNELANDKDFGADRTSEGGIVSSPVIRLLQGEGI